MGIDHGECVLSIVIVYWPWQWMLTVVMCIGHSNGYCHGNVYTLAMCTEVFAIVMGIDHGVWLLHLLDYPHMQKVYSTISSHQVLFQHCSDRTIV